MMLKYDLGKNELVFSTYFHFCSFMVGKYSHFGFGLLTELDSPTLIVHDSIHNAIDGV